MSLKLGAESLAGSLLAGFEDSFAEAVASVPVDGRIAAYALDSGHRTRPLACLVACVAVGGESGVAMDSAIGIELIHKASVIRDDIADGDLMRSGKPSLHVSFGVPTALAASDVFWTSGVSYISGPASDPRREMRLAAVAATLAEMASGQMEDISPQLDFGSTDARLVVDERKTGALAGLACWLGGVAGSTSPSAREALARYGRKMGTAFQVLNNVRNLIGQENHRLPGSDLQKRRDTVLSAYVRKRIGLDLRGSDYNQEDIETAILANVRSEMIAAGAVEFGERLALSLLSEARRELLALPDGPGRNLLERLASGELLKVYAF